MAVLKKRECEKVTLPVSGVVCDVLMTWGDKMKLNALWTKDVKMEVGVEGDKQKTMEVSASTMEVQRRLSLELCVKGWDATDESGKAIPCTVENMESLLDSEDGAFLDAHLTALMTTSNSKEVKKG